MPTANSIPKRKKRTLQAAKSPLPAPSSALYALGLEGSANKLGVGVVCHLPNGSVEILSNVRHTYVTPPGQGFQPGDTAKHHKQWLVRVVEQAVKRSGKKLEEMQCICFTKGESVSSGCRWKTLEVPFDR